MTTSGSWADFSARSIAAPSARGVDVSMGGEKTRLASLPHAGQETDSGAVPSARVTSNAPSSSHRYSYVAMRQFAAIGTCTPCWTWCGFPAADGATSKSKIRRGM